ncbi:hypothetical protein Leryth_015029, partial [Lithospermum erythrorhizon]
TPSTALSVSYPPLPPPPYLYPVGSSGRGYYPPKQPNPQRLPSPLFPYDNPPNIDSGAPQLPQGLGFMPPPHHFHNMLPASIGGLSPRVVNGVPLFKMSSNQTPGIDNNGFKEARDRSRDDCFVIVRGRKVRVSEDSSLYSLCRSWLRNGLPEETEPPYIDVVKSLPRPLPLAPQVFQSTGKKEEQEEDEEEEGAGFVEHLSPQDLLQKHIKRAKRVRSRLREERLRRIARYKTRLSLLLPPIVEQHCRNESTAGNGNAS